MSEELIKRLREQAAEIAKAGHNGWGNTMMDAADALSRPALAVQVPEGELWSFLCRVLDEGAKLGRDFSGEHYYAFRDWTASEYVKKLAAAPTPATVATEAVAQGGGVDAGTLAKAIRRVDRRHDLSVLSLAEAILAELPKVTGRALLASAPAAVDGWIAVGDRLPLEPDASVPYRTADVLATDGREVHQMQFCGGHIGGPGAWVCWESYGYFIPSQITHWQPLPPAPAATKKENGE